MSTQKKDYRFIVKYIIAWRILLFLLLFVAIRAVSLQSNFLGGGIDNYLKTPYLWAWVNFDGEHYLSIAQRGYQPLTYFFFPVYPLIVRLISSVFVDSFVGQAVTGLLVSHISILLALVGLWKLLSLDYKKEIIQLTILLLLIFPTSFYFASFYTESVFLALVVWSLYFARKRRWLLASLLAGLASATRVTGIVLLPALFVEYLWGG